MTELNEWAQASARIVQDGACRCTEDDACWDHEALEMQAEHERLGGGAA